MTLLLAVIVVMIASSWQDVFGFSARGAAALATAACKCCAQHGKGPVMDCCAKQVEPGTPLAPASLPSFSQDEQRAMAAPVSVAFIMPCLSACPLWAAVAPIPTGAAVPIFRRGCSYLL